MKDRRIAWGTGILAATLCFLFASSALAYRGEWGPFQFRLDNRVTLGATMRIQKRNPDMISKLNLNPKLCPDSCLYLGNPTSAYAGDPLAPNQRLVDAPGGFMSALGDDADLSYDQWDITSGQIRMKNTLTVYWHRIALHLKGFGFYDPVVTNKQFYHPANFQDVPKTGEGGTPQGNKIADLQNGSLADPTLQAFQPRYTSLPHSNLHQIGYNYQLLDYYVSIPFTLFDHNFFISAGRQRVHWGQALFNVLGSLDQLNPPDQNRLYFPGTDIASVFEPTGMVVFDTQITPNLGLELVWQYRWRPAVPAAYGSFFNRVEGGGGYKHAALSLGQFTEDPNRIGGLTNPVARIATSTHLGLNLDTQRGNPTNKGEYGAKLDWYIPWLNGGTDLSFYYLNYHARLPYFSVIAANKSCARESAGQLIDPTTGVLDVVTQPLTGLISGVLDGLNDQVLSGLLGQLGLTDQSQLVGVLAGKIKNLKGDSLKAAIACGGFDGDGTLAQTLQGVFGALQPAGNSDDPFPVGSAKPFLDRPENIHMLGLSFTTNAFGWAFAGEYAFRPNQPLQVQLSDVFFAAIQPAMPNRPIDIVLGDLPGNRVAAPDYIETLYRGHNKIGDDGHIISTVQPHQLIRGYERFHVHTFDFTAIKLFGGSNPLKADQITLALELGGTWIPNMPAANVLPLESLDLRDSTHFSAGADGSGHPNPAQQKQAQWLRLNPRHEPSRYMPDNFSTGFRVLAQLEYNHFFRGWNYKPQVAFFWDIYGVAPMPIQNYIQGRTELIVDNTIEFTHNFLATLEYQGFYGGVFNPLGDRGNVKLSVSYSF